MKKSKLKNIIRESIKELIGEQFINYDNIAPEGPGNQYTLSNIQDVLDYIEINGSLVGGYSLPGGGNAPAFRYSVCYQQACANGYWTGPDCDNPGTGCINIQHTNTDMNTITTPGGGLSNSVLDASNDPNSGYYDLIMGPNPYQPCPAACEAYTPPPPPEPEFQSIGDTEYDPEFFDDENPGGAADQGEEVTGFQFPEGFDPTDWMNSWAINLYQYLGSDMSGVCDFLSERISTWTNQYESAGPLYQNQLVFKIQAAYMLQSYLPCSGSLEEQAMGVSLPSNLTSLIKNLAKKTASNLIKSLEQKSRMKKLANIKPPRKR